jgi:hypothetical protein
MKRRTGFAAGLLGLIVAIGFPAVAHAGPVGPAGNCLYATNNGSLVSGGSYEQQGNGNFGVTTTAPFWSVIAGYGGQGENSDVALHGAPWSTCNLYKSSAAANPIADWVAFDNNSGRLPIGGYTAQFSQAAEFFPQFVAGNRALLTGSPTTDQSIGYDPSPWTVDVRDVLLSGGHSYSFRVTGGFSSIYLVRSLANDSTTWSMTRDNATHRLELPLTNPNAPSQTDVTDISRTGTLTLHDTNVNAWYGFIVVRNAFWGVPVSVRVSTTTP